MAEKKESTSIPLSQVAEAVDPENPATCDHHQQPRPSGSPSPERASSAIDGHEPIGGAAAALQAIDSAVRVLKGGIDATKLEGGVPSKIVTTAKANVRLELLSWGMLASHCKLSVCSCATACRRGPSTPDGGCPCVARLPPVGLKAAERGGYEGERYEKIEFQKKVAEHYYSFRDSTWKVVDGSLPMEIVEEKPRDLATSCIQECQGDPLANLA